MAGDQAQRGKRERLLVLGAGPAQLGLLQAARRRGLYVVAADRDPAAPGFPYADRRALISAEDEPALERLAQVERIEGVIAPGIDWPVAVAARIADRLALPHPVDPKTAALATSKLRQRERFAAAGVPQPRWARIATADEVGFPCVVKAPDRQGQRGLSIVHDRSERDQAVRLALEASRSGAALVEEMIDGPEVTVNAFSLDGSFHPLTVTDRLTAEPPAFGVALAHAWPSEAAAEVVEAARTAADALGIRNGPTYTQIRIGRDGPRVVEVAARLGGGHDAELCRAALGVDLDGLALAAALGKPIEDGELRAQPRVGGACTLFLVAPPGELARVEGVEDALAAEGVLDVRIYRRAGYRFGPLRTGSDRAGAILAVGGSRDEALARARAAAALVRFTVEPGPGQERAGTARIPAE